MGDIQEWICCVKEPPAIVALGFVFRNSIIWLLTYISLQEIDMSASNFIFKENESLTQPWLRLFETSLAKGIPTEKYNRVGSKQLGTLLLMAWSFTSCRRCFSCSLCFWEPWVYWRLYFHCYHGSYGCYCTLYTLAVIFSWSPGKQGRSRNSVQNQRFFILLLKCAL